MTTRRWLEALLRLYPEEFRTAHRGEVEDFVEAELDGARRWRALTCLKLAWDLTTSALSLRLRPAPRGLWSLIAERGGERTLLSTGEDLKLVCRSILRSPGLPAVVVATLALGVGLNTAIFSVVHAVLLRPLDYAEPDRLVHLSIELPALEIEDVLVSGGDMTDLRAGIDALEALEGVSTIRQTLTGTGLPRQIEVGWVSGGMLEMLGVDAALGRLHRPDDPPGTLLLSHELWRDAFASDAGVVGQSITLDGHAYSIVGVMPAGFRLRMPFRTGEVTDIAVWKNPDGFWQNGNFWEARGPEFAMIRLVGRLAPGASIADAQAGANLVAADLRRRYPEHAESGFRVTVYGLQERLVAGVRPTLTLLLGAVLFVLLIACANVANLLLTRGQARQREIAIRLAIGSARARVGRFVMLESLMLALLGAGAGMGIAWWAVAVIPQLAPPELPMVDTVRLDATVVWFALTVTFLTTLLVGALPTISAIRMDPGAVLGNAGMTRAGASRVGDGLAVVQMALSFVLLVGAGLVTSSLARMQRVEIGFDPSSLYSFGVSIPGTQYGWPEEADRFYRDVEQRVRDLPGVEAAGIVWPMPLSEPWSGDLAVVDDEVRELGLAGYRLATEAYFSTARIPLFEGRLFRADQERSVAVISQAVSERAWRGRSPLGRTLRANPWGGGMQDFEVIGVVGDVVGAELREASPGTIYFDSRGWSWVDWEVHVVLRSSVAEETLLPQLRAVIAELDGEVPIAHPEPMDEAYRRETVSARFVLTLLGAFALTAGLLAIVGLYGVMSYSVGLRWREIGIRIALGSARSEIRAMVVRRALLLAGIGVVIGLFGAQAAGGLLQALLFDVRPGDPMTYGLVAGGLGAAAAFAGWIPALRASRLDPTAVLKAD